MLVASTLPTKSSPQPDPLKVDKQVDNAQVIQNEDLVIAVQKIPLEPQTGSGAPHFPPVAQRCHYDSDQQLQKSLTTFLYLRLQGTSYVQF